MEFIDNYILSSYRRTCCYGRCSPRDGEFNIGMVSNNNNISEITLSIENDTTVIGLKNKLKTLYNAIAIKIIIPDNYEMLFMNHDELSTGFIILDDDIIIKNIKETLGIDTFIVECV